MINQGDLESAKGDRNETYDDANENTRGRSGTLGAEGSKSHARHNKNSRSPMRQNKHQRNKKSRSPKRNQHQKKSLSPNRGNYENKSRSPTRRGGARKKKPAAMTVIVNRCDLWDSAAHFQPDECFRPQIKHSNARALPYKFENGELASNFLVDQVRQPPPPPGLEKQEDATLMSVTTARVPHHVESIQFPIKTNDECSDRVRHCDVIDTTIPNPHDPNVVHDKYWAQRR